MNFFEQELRSLLGNRPVFNGATYVGRACIAPLGDGTRLKVEFDTTDVSGHYDAVKLSVISAKEGTVDTLKLYHSDYLRKAIIGSDPANMTIPHIWEGGRFGVQWYPMKPNAAALKPLADAVCNYAKGFKRQRVPVAVWDISSRDERNLDFYEGHPTYYRKEQCSVTLSNGRAINGMVYLMNGGQIGMPTRSYYDGIRDAYIDLGLEEYIAPILRLALAASMVWCPDEWKEGAFE